MEGPADLRRRREGELVVLGVMCALTWARRSVAVVDGVDVSSDGVDASLGGDGGDLSPAMVTSVILAWTGGMECGPKTERWSGSHCDG